MKEYVAINPNSDGKTIRRAKGSICIKIRAISDSEYLESERSLHEQLRLARQRREKCEHNCRELASSTLCRD